jgi:hypothetical protein
MDPKFSRQVADNLQADLVNLEPGNILDRFSAARAA